MTRRTKRLRRRLRDGKIDAKQYFGIRINAAMKLSDKELAALNDTFPKGEFWATDWSAQTFLHATEIRMQWKRERCQRCLSETIRWSRKAIPAAGKVRVVL